VKPVAAVAALLLLVASCGASEPEGQVHDECEPYADAFGDRLLQIECTDEAFRKSCADRGGKVSIIRRDRNVVPQGHADYVDEVCPAS
jgi:hypothetical protein